MTDIKVAYERNITTLLSDSLALLLSASKLHFDDEMGHTHSRASITFSLLLLEAVANTCLEHLSLGRSFQNEVDRLPVLAKFDLHARLKTQHSGIDRSTRAVQVFKELKSLRDGLVHLKAHAVKWKGHIDSGQTAEANRTSALDVATDPSFWQFRDAKRVAGGVHEFLGFYFEKVCRYSQEETSALLFSEQKIPGGDDHRIPAFDIATRRQLQRFGVDLSYLHIVWS